MPLDAGEGGTGGEAKGRIPGAGVVGGGGTAGGTGSFVDMIGSMVSGSRQGYRRRFRDTVLAQFGKLTSSLSFVRGTSCLSVTGFDSRDRVVGFSAVGNCLSILCGALLLVGDKVLRLRGPDLLLKPSWQLASSICAGHS